MGLNFMISVLDFSILDWLLIAILAFSIGISAVRGFFREAIGLAAVFTGLLLAAWSYRRVGGLFKEVVKTENLALFLGFSVIFLGTLLAGTLAIWLVTKFVRLARLQWFDRLLGAAFGFIRGWVIGAVILLGLTAFDVQTDRVRNSELAPYFLRGSRVLAVATPYELKAKFLVGYRAVERWWQDTNETQ
jgi:membrane protein required for colicin V production